METGRAPQVESHQNDYKPRGPQGAPSLVNKRNREERKRLGLKKKMKKAEKEREGKSLIVPSSKGLNLKTVEDLVQGYGTVQRKRPMVGSKHLTRLVARTRKIQLY